MSSLEISLPLLIKEEISDAAEVLVRPITRRQKLGLLGQWIVAGLVGGFIVSIHDRMNLDLAGILRPSKLVKNDPEHIVRAPYRNIWQNIDVDTAVSVRKWLMHPDRQLNLTKSNEAVESDNWIQLVEAYTPPKDLALAYLSNYTSSPPPKYAHAIIHHGPEEVIRDYQIGPLPISNITTITSLDGNYHNTPIPLNAHATFNWTRLGQQFYTAFEPLEPALQDLFGASIGDGGLAVAGVAPMSYDGSWRKTWVQLRRNGPGSWLRPLDFFAYSDMTGTDPSLYRITSIVHNKTLYPSPTAFLDAWRNATLHRAPKEGPSEWATRKPREGRRELDDLPGPRQVGQGRYAIDLKEQWVKWMGWDFFIGFERDMGVHLWNINLLGERLIYELSPQEAMAQYSGYDPHQASTVWLDSAFGMGLNVRNVIRGYDCPHDATYLSATVHERGSTIQDEAICVFEREGTRPLSRHIGGEKDESGALKWYELVVRSISTVGNYDYIFDYTFQLDGTVEIRVSASGYLQGGLWQPEQDVYGHQLSPEGMGSLHDHVINYKIDFDVGGTKNSFMAVSLEVEQKSEAWFEDDWGSPIHQQRIVRRPVKTETTLNYPANMEGAYVVLSHNSTNEWSNPRGYAIHPGPLCRLTNLESKRTEKSVEWAKSHLGVSRRKDGEGRSSSGWNMNLPGRPPVDYSKFFDGESIDGEDLVVWLNLGTHHIPRAEDTPNTLTNVATSYVSLIPWNWFNEDASIDSRNSILLNKNKKTGEWESQEGVQGRDGHDDGVRWSEGLKLDESGERIKKDAGIDGHLNKVVLGPRDL